MSKFREALGLQPVVGPRTAARQERNEHLKAWADKGYRVIGNTRTDQGAGSPKPAPPEHHNGRGR